MKILTSFRLSVEAKDLIKQMAEKLSISQTAVIELAVRHMAKEQGVYGPSQLSELLKDN